jgi:hypothetical protein
LLAGLTRLHKTDATLLDGLKQPGQQGAFARALAALEADEFSTRCGCSYRTH